MLCGIIKSDWANKEANFNLLGVPLDITSSYRNGARYGPDNFRKILSSENFECTSETEVDLTKHYKIKDWGNVGIINSSISKSLQMVSEGVSELLRLEKPFLVIGGDHSTTIGVSQSLEDLNIPTHFIYLDSHLDLYEELMETKYSHACTLRRLIELEMFDGATLLGYRDFTLDQLNYARNSNVNLYSTRDLTSTSDLYQFGYDLGIQIRKKHSYIHISLDLDILDPSVAPGVGNPVATGLNTRELLGLLSGIFTGLRSKRFSWDIVEYNPLYDLSEITGFLMVKIIIESLSAMLIP